MAEHESGTTILLEMYRGWNRNSKYYFFARILELLKNEHLIHHSTNRNLPSKHYSQAEKPHQEQRLSRGLSG
ncbi:MAG: hypothetical protein RL062_933 [Bacteroidota bacterium]